VNLAINRYTGSGGGDSGTPRVKFAIVQNGSGVTTSEYLTSIAPDVIGPTIFGHNGAANASSVAADGVGAPTGPQAYSSRGPVTLYFAPVSGTTAAAPLAAPQVLSKPDVTATDCNSNTFFGGGNKFCGTSAAAPHAAAVGALQLQADPALTPASLRSLQNSTATPLAGFGPFDVGGGLLNAGASAPPRVTVSSGPPALSANRTPAFTFSASHNATFSCSLDGVVVACASPFTAPAFFDGQHTVVVTARDALGHVGSSAPVSFTVDATAPDTSITSGPEGATRNKRPAFGFKSNDAAAGFQCRFDGQPFGACSGPGNTSRAAASLRDGAHTFDVRALDAVPNIDATPARAAIRVDTRRPKAKLKRHPAKTTGSRRARFTFSANEKRVRFECKLDRKRFKRCRSPRVVNVGAGKHVFRVRAKDAAGNRSKAKTFRWRVL
jgi:hypothetical protein